MRETLERILRLLSKPRATAGGVCAVYVMNRPGPHGGSGVRGARLIRVARGDARRWRRARSAFF